MLRKVPLVVILGSTGTGKTKLSLELAKRFGGEIVSADSMQVYANLDIVTAKASKEEQSRAKHHLLDVTTPAEPYTVVHFRNAALPIIEKLLAQSKSPIVVGGTNYYIESLLWDILVSPRTSTPTFDLKDTNAAAGKSDNSTSENAENPLRLSDAEMTKMPSEMLHSHLKIIDPESANRMHPKNKRKIMRAIEVFQQTGHTLSAKLHQQRQQPGGNRLGGPLRYPHIIIFWLRCNQDVLNKRLDKRVDAMLEQGLLREIRAFHDEHKCGASSSSGSDGADGGNRFHYTKGVLQTIGFKEFIPYLEQFNAANDLEIEEYLLLNAYKMPTEEHFNANKTKNNKKNSDGGKNSAFSSLNEHNADTTTATTEISIPKLPPGMEQLQECLNELKLVTRRYSKKQIKWINNRFLASKDRQVPDLYELDTTNISAWQELVYNPAVNVIDCYRNDKTCKVAPLAKRTHPGAELIEETSNFCQVCHRHFIGEFQWKLHLASNKHKKRKDGIRKKQKMQDQQLERVHDSDEKN